MGRDPQRHSGYRSRMRRGLRLCDLPCLRRRIWREKVGAPSPMEEDMLDFGFDVRPNSRLSCQIKVSDDLDGLVVTTPGGRRRIGSIPLH